MRRCVADADRGSSLDEMCQYSRAHTYDGAEGEDDAYRRATEVSRSLKLRLAAYVLDSLPDKPREGFESG
jgi:hypothetical protein